MVSPEGCSVCLRNHKPKLPFYCPGCARNAVYELRLEQAKGLLAREASQKDAVETVSHGPESARSDKDAASSPEVNSWDIYRVTEEKEAAGCRIHEIETRADVLRKEIQSARSDLSKLKSALDRRRADFASATHNLVGRRKSTVESVDKNIKRVSYRADQQHQRTAESRIYLCREAAKLCGLQQRRRRRGDGTREDYFIGGVGIVDLKDLGHASHTQINTSFARVCHLVVLTSHYLALQLPAEIILPHRDQPNPMIFSPSSSYLSRSGSYPTTPTSRPSIAAFSLSRGHGAHPQSRPRPLSLQKPLSQLAKEDAVAYSLFIEGVTLLAWDVAWACRTQGINVGAQSLDEICSIGKLLYQLLVSPPATLLPPLRRMSHNSHDASSDRGSSPTSNTVARDITPLAPAMRRTASARLQILGRYSHGTAHSFLGGAEGTEFMRGWKLQGPMKMVDHLKSLLLGEMAGAEWEVVDEKEWRDLGDESGSHAGAAGAAAEVAAATANETHDQVAPPIPSSNPNDSEAAVSPTTKSVSASISNTNARTPPLARTRSQQSPVGQGLPTRPSAGTRAATAAIAMARTRSNRSQQGPARAAGVATSNKVTSPTQNQPQPQPQPAQSAQQKQPEAKQEEGEAEAEEKDLPHQHKPEKSGSSGWMKLRSRP